MATGPDDKNRTTEKMGTSLAQTVGIDISKATLGVYARPAGCERRFANSAKGLISWLAQWQIDRIAYEATGAHHRQLEQALADLPCVKLNPARARWFAQAVGTLVLRRIRSTRRSLPA